MPNNFAQSLLKQPTKLLAVVLGLTALHSFAMGITLITQPLFLMEKIGFDRTCERFFPAQGGVFHILMGLAYLMGAVDAEKHHDLIGFAIVVKLSATLFLTVYCFAVDFKWIILLSGISDFIMGLAIFLTWHNYLRRQKYIQQQAYL